MNSESAARTFSARLCQFLPEFTGPAVRWRGKRRGAPGRRRGAPN